jgi:hypothetical protein
MRTRQIRPSAEATKPDFWHTGINMSFSSGQPLNRKLKRDGAGKVLVCIATKTILYAQPLPGNDGHWPTIKKRRDEETANIPQRRKHQEHGPHPPPSPLPNSRPPTRNALALPPLLFPRKRIPEPECFVSRTSDDRLAVRAHCEV